MVAVDQQTRDVVVLYGGAVVLIAEEIGETVAVEFVESVLSTYPDKAIVVLYDIVYHTARQPSNVYLNALESRLVMTLSNWMRSIHTLIGVGYGASVGV